MPNFSHQNIASQWFKIKISKKKYIMLAGYYRQWRLPGETQIINSGSSESQMGRFDLFLNQIKRAKSMSNDQKVLVIGDVNIDMSLDKDNAVRPDLKRLIPRGLCHHK